MVWASLGKVTGQRETAVADYLSRFAREEGLSVHIDRAANLIFSQKGVNEDTPAVWIGSHIDSVPQGEISMVLRALLLDC